MGFLLYDVSLGSLPKAGEGHSCLKNEMEREERHNSKQKIKNLKENITALCRRKPDLMQFQR